MQVNTIIDLIGNTPLVAIDHLSPSPKVKIFAKLEGQNPTGSVKDRVAWSMVQAAEGDGTLRPGEEATLLEPSSGNTGISLAWIARQRGYKVKVVLPGNVSNERRQVLAALGAELVPSPAAEGSNGAVRLAQRLSADDPDLVFLNQYANPANVAAHYETTGPEIWRDCPEITAFVAGLGTGGTLTGAGQFLKEQNPDIAVVAAEPPAGETVQGLRSLDDGYIPPIFDPDVLDRKTIIRAGPSVTFSRRLLHECGIFAGPSAGAAVAAALNYAKRLESGTIVVLLADGGWKYLSTGLWTDDLTSAQTNLSNTLYF